MRATRPSLLLSLLGTLSSSLGFYGYEYAYAAPPGFQIQDSCKLQFGEAEITRVIDQSMKTGLACLERLGTPAAEENRLKITALVQDTAHPAALVCDETEGYEWKGVAAKGTVPGNDGHPRISINPTLKSESPHLALQATLFHELFHNIGYLHERDPEFPYACQACCFTEKGQTMKARALGCKICSGNYPEGSDHEYLRDLVHFLGANSIAFHARRVVFNYLRQHPDDRKALLLLIEAVKQEPGLKDVAYSLADQYRERYARGLTLTEELQLLPLHLFLVPKDKKSATEKAAPLGRAIFLILEGEAEKASELLKAFHAPPASRMLQLKDDLELSTQLPVPPTHLL